MGYKIRRGKPLFDEIRRIMEDRIEAAIQRLDDFSEDPDERVHAFRKDMKKTRAALRLIRCSIPKKSYKALNATFRDLSKQFAPARESAVHLETLDRLDHDSRASNTLEQAVGRLQKQHRQEMGQIGERPDRLENMQAELKRSKDEINALSTDRSGFDPVRGGLKKVYQRGRKALAEARSDPDGERLHEWRKRLKYLWYHMRLLRQAWPTVMKGSIQSLDRLSDDLGLEHDWFDLKGFLSTSGGLEPRSEAGAPSLMDRIDQKRKQLRDGLWPVGQKIYVEKPRHFADRIGRYWEIENH